MTNGIGLVHGAFPVIMHWLAPQCYLRHTNTATEFVIVGMVCVALAFYSRMFFRVLHRSMISFLRHRQVGFVGGGGATW